MQSDINLNFNALDEWIDYRKEIKKPLKPTTVKKLAKKLALWNYDYQQQVVDYSIEQGYQGLFEPKQQKPKQNNLTHEQDFISMHSDSSWADSL